MDCDSSQVCDICEIIKEVEIFTKTSPMRKSKMTTTRSITIGAALPITRGAPTAMPSIDHQIVTILKRLHTSMCGPERTCRWYYHDAKQVYYCDHVAIAARDVADQYWKMFNS